jgi:gliding motility-associated lipoprotein GldD
MKRTFQISFAFLSLITFIFLIPGCNDDYSPKPRGYFRIDFPEKTYNRFDTTYPYTFEYPSYAKVVADTRPTSEPYWINIDFPEYQGKIHISRSMRTLVGFLRTAVHLYLNIFQKLMLLMIP